MIKNQASGTQVHDQKQRYQMLELRERILKNFDNYVGEFAGSQERPAEGKELFYGNAQKRSCTLLLALPPIYLSRFRPWNKMIYTYWQKLIG